MNKYYVHGAETWVAVKKEEKRFDVKEMRNLRWKCGET